MSKQTISKILLFTVALLLILLRKWICQTEHTHCPLWFLKFSVTLHQNICFDHCNCQPPVYLSGCFLLVLNQRILMFPSLHSFSVKLQVTLQGNLLYGWTNICINVRRLVKSVIQLCPACRWLISENPYMVILWWRQKEREKAWEKRQIKVKTW